MTPHTLNSFGVWDSDPRSYLLDIDRRIIIAEGAPETVAAKVKDWEAVAPGRYHAVSGGEVDAGILYEWDRFKAREGAHWVI